MGNVWHIVVRFKSNLNSYFIMEDFVSEVQKVFTNIDEDILRTLKQAIEELEDSVTNFVNSAIKTIDKYINKIKT